MHYLDNSGILYIKRQGVFVSIKSKRTSFILFCDSGKLHLYAKIADERARKTKSRDHAVIKNNQFNFSNIQLPKLVYRE